MFASAHPGTALTALVVAIVWWRLDEQIADWGRVPPQQRWLVKVMPLVFLAAAVVILASE